MCFGLQPQELKERRDGYNFPNVGLTGSLDNYQEIRFETQLLLEEYNSGLLRNANAQHKTLGYLSVLYWGHYAGQGAPPNPGFARAKVSNALEGFERRRNGQQQIIQGARNIGWAAIGESIQDAVAEINEHRFGQAALRLTDLPGIQFAFASKLCAFLAPLRCGVIDSVIARNYPQFGFCTINNRYIRTNLYNADRYTDFCDALYETAVQQNRSGDEFKWVDCDGLHDWRAVDVERALYVAPA
jgi:hypothetical protein